VGDISVEKLVQLLAVTQQNYYDLKPIATKNPRGLVSEGLLLKLRGLQSFAKETLGELPRNLVPDIDDLAHGGWERPRYEAALMWLGALHAYVLATLPAEKGEERRRYGLDASD